MAIDLTVELHGFSTIWDCSNPKKPNVFLDFLLVLGGCLYEWNIEWDEHI